MMSMMERRQDVGKVHQHRVVVGRDPNRVEKTKEPTITTRRDEAEAEYKMKNHKERKGKD